MTINTSLYALFLGALFGISCQTTPNTHRPTDISQPNIVILDIYKIMSYNQTLLQCAAPATSPETPKPRYRARSLGRTRVVSGKLVLDSYTIGRRTR